MSHIADIKLDIKDLDSLKKACSALGLEFIEDQKTYKWYGRHMGDYPPPEGFTVDDLGKCEHAIKIKGNSEAYEIGIVKARNGRPGYQLLWDFWRGGFGLQEKIGKDGGLLKQRYSAEVAKKHALREGWRVTEELNSKGELILTAVR